MAFEEYDDYEQEQMVKEWLGNNWLTIVAGIGLGIGGLWGYGKWQDSQVSKSTEAATEYVQLAAEIDASELTNVDALIDGYEAEFGANVYTIEARMKAAKKFVEAKDLGSAKAQYQALIATKPDKPIAEMARLRLARLLVAEGDYSAAKAELGLVQSAAYQTIVEEVMGDIYAAEGDISKAQDSYQLALNEGEGYSGKQIVEMKLADIKSIN
ncbi:tetratricopeptide repeat protein [Marinicella sp. S1101]|uniref:YfgM family protein n=1 Tax=Marinicella marina TaxID=2996016 RepID=UPI002260F8D4|nr:tetratricopeptide repeat protein [Marinicella marina]MCX7553622.1 tetratricopeptide repeat protein [Marinicella marina]MDJ1140246.1 tetratricopeptide repeat protein [Marinicella marina]